MALITRVGKAGGGTNFNTGQIIEPAEVNDDFNTVYTLVNGGLDEANIESGSVTAASIAPGSITAACLAPDSVGETQIQSSTIPGSKLLKFTDVPTQGTPAASTVLAYSFVHNGSSHVGVQDSSNRLMALGAHTTIGGAVGTNVRGGSVGLVKSHVIGSTTPANTIETDLITYDFPASGLAQDGACLRIRTHWLTSANANGKTIRLYFGTVMCMISTGPHNGFIGMGDTLIQRTGGGSGRYTTHLVTGPLNGTQAVVMQMLDFGPGVVWTNVHPIKVTGQNSVAAANEITAYAMNIEVLNYPV